MTAPQVLEQSAHRPHFAVGVVDALARALHASGALPVPLGELSLGVVAQTAPASRTFDPPRVLSTFRNASGFFILDGTYTDPGPDAVRRPLADGTYVVRVSSTFYDDQDFTLDWPQAAAGRVKVGPPNQPDNVVLFPSPAYPLPDVTLEGLQLGPTVIRGSLRTAAGEPRAGVPVEIVNLPAFLAPPELPALALADWPFSRTRSSAEGDWAALLPRRRYLTAMPEVPPGANPPPLTQVFTVRIGPAAGPFTLVQATVTLGRENSVRNTSLRGQVLGSGARPLSGVVITTSASAATSVSRADGRWSLFFALDQGDVDPVTVTATTPAGATLSVTNSSVRTGSTVVVPTFRFS